MSLNDISGPGGTVLLPSGIAMHVSAWSATVELEDVETTGFIEMGNRSFANTTVMVSGAAVGTVQGGSGTASALLMATSFGTAPAMTAWSGTITLIGSGWNGVTTTAGGSSWSMSFNANIKAVALNRAQNGKLDAAITFKSSVSAAQSQSITINQP
jgi:hypothetical protein